MIRPLDFAGHWRRIAWFAALVLAGAAVSTGASAQAAPASPTICDRAAPEAREGPRAPRLTGLPFDQAEQILQRYHATARRIAVQSDAPQGQVVNQWPKPGQTMGRFMLLCSSNGAQAAGPRMPWLVGQRVDAARQMLSALRIRNPPEIRTAAHPEAEGLIFGQSPAARTPVNAATRITLNVSAGPPPPPQILMPALVGQTLDSARQMLVERGIRNAPVIQNAEHPEAEGLIFGQSPPAQTPINAATRIMLNVSAGPTPPPPILMPALVGRTLDEARQMLAERGIANSVEIRHAGHAEAAGSIYRQSPVAGAPVGAADAIMLDISDGPPPDVPPIARLVTVPPLEGLQEAEATASLQRLGLAAALDESEESLLPQGQVARSIPGAGEQVQAGATVRLVLSLGPPAQTESMIDRLLGNPIAILAAILAAIAIVALAVKLLMPRRPRFTVHMAGPPQGMVDWGEPPEFAFEVRVDPPKASMRRLAADADEEGAGA
jgi:beta-lactam-binding protein with PASTA domain